MQIVIKLDKRLYKHAKHHTLTSTEIDEICDAIASGVPLPKGAEILTKEAYSDLCTRAANSCTTTDSSTGSSTTRPCEDCISRQALQEWIKNKTFGDIVVASEHNFDCLSSVEPERKLGKWIECGGDEPWLKGYCCSLCNFTTTQKYDYCTCGAKMEGKV